MPDTDPHQCDQYQIGGHGSPLHILAGENKNGDAEQPADFGNQCEKASTEAYQQKWEHKTLYRLDSGNHADLLLNTLFGLIHYCSLASLMCAARAIAAPRIDSSQPGCWH